MSVIEVVDVTRIYTTERRRVVALDSLRMEVREGEVFGLLGPNGVGKTTLVKVLTTVITPTSGSARVLGFDVRTQPAYIRPRIGVSYGGELGLYWRLTGRQNLDYACRLYNMSAREARRRVVEMLDVFGLTVAADRRVNTYSRGMRHRLHLARALIHDPQVVFLDEPTTGLDPVAAQEVREIIAARRSVNRTVLLTTHNMSEADALCDRIAIINQGRLVALGSPADLKRDTTDQITIELRIAATHDPVSLSASLQRHLGPDTLVSAETGDSVTRVVATVRHGVPLAGLAAAVGDATILAVSSRGTTLEDVYLKHLRTGRVPG
jgi:ABC-2 type transport system ATP-binding protein